MPNTAEGEIKTNNNQISYDETCLTTRTGNITTVRTKTEGHAKLRIRYSVPYKRLKKETSAKKLPETKA
jgi:hypothetical protein